MFSIKPRKGMLSDVAFSVYEWSNCVFTQHALLSVEGLIDKMRHIYPLNTRHVFITLMLFVALAVGFFLLFPGGFAQAQGTGAITYQENGTDPVSTFTATDPEGGAIYWSLLTTLGDAEVDGVAVVQADIDDAEDFSISVDGVLTFNIPPDYESPDDDDDTDNVYNIVVVASDGALGAGTTDNPTMMGYMKVVVTVTDVDEPGMLTLSSLQPQVGVVLTATLTDPEVAPLPTGDDVTWKWEKSQDMSSWAVIDSVSAAMRTPDATTDGYYLRATATYDDTANNDRTAQVVSVNKVRVAPTTTDSDAAFPTGSDARSVDENSPAGANVGDPVKANDTVDDVLTYSLSGTDDDSFEIDPATGQITVGPRTMLDEEMKPTYMVTVTATEAGGSSRARTQAVTIAVNDVNEAPMVTGGVTMRDYAENTTDAVSDYTTSDPEEGDVTLSLQGADASKFRISTAGALTFRDAPDYEMPADAGTDNVYNVTVVATDAGINNSNKMTAMREVTIMVTNVDEEGTVNLSAQQPMIGVALTASVTDLDGDVTDVTWEWERDDNETDDETNTGNEEVIEGAESATYTPTMADEAKYLRAIATYTDGKGKTTMSATSAGVAQVRTDNAPTFPKTEDGRRSIPENSPDGTALGDPVLATDADAGQLLTYSLSGADAGSFTITQDNPSTDGTDEGGQIAVKAGTKLDHEAKSTYMVTVTATDPDGLSASIDVTIMVTGMNEGPEVTGDSAIDNYAEKGTSLVARFTATDPEGGTIYWSLLETVGTIEVDGVRLAQDDVEDFDAFSISADGVLTFNIPPDYESPDDADPGDSVYNIVVVASDGAPGAGTTDNPTMMGYMKVVVTVTNVDEDGTVTLSSLQPQVDVVLTATLTDPEVAPLPTGNDVTWKWEKSRSRTSGWTALGGVDAAMRTPDGTTDGYYLRATATYDDTANNDRTAQVVSVNKVRVAPTTTDEDATFPDGSDARSVDENSPAGTNVGDPVKANDTVDDVLTYSLSGTDDDSFEIDPATAQITVGPRTMLDEEMKPTYMVTVTATEAGGSSRARTQAVTIAVNDVNEAPMVTGGVTMRDYAENTTDAVSDYTTSDPEEGDVTLSLQGADASKFRISTAGALTFRDAPDYEMPADAGTDNVYNVTVVVTDAGINNSNKMTAMREVTIMVTNVDEEGTVTLSTRQPKIGVALTASVTDLDGDVTDVTWEWERDDNETDDETNTGDEEVIEGAESATYTPTMADQAKYLRAIATYTDGKGKTTTSATSATQAIIRTDNAPTFPKTEDGRRSIEEGMTGSVGDPVRAMDAEATQLLTYSLSGADAGSFTIMSDTGTLDADRGGLISVKAGTKLDHEAKSTYMVTVTATDPGNNSGSTDVTITITDENEAPTIMVGGLAISGRSNVDYAENGTDPVATFRVVGPDAASASWSLEGSDAGDFDISSGGVLTFRSSPDYDMPADADTDNTYMVTVKADDGTYMDTHEVAIMVTEVVDEAPTTISGMSNVEYAENRTDMVATYTAVGPNAASARWSLAGTDAGVFDISAAGVLTFSSSPDYETPADADTDNTYMVTVTAGDATYEVAIMVIGVDEVPKIAGDDTIDYAENGTAPVATYTAMDPEETAISWSLAGDDADVFDISTDGVLTFKESPDYEMLADADADNTYMVTIHATDATMKTGMKTVMVMVIGVDEVPKIAGDDTIDYAENGTASVATYTAMDPEETAISWSLAGDDADVFDIAGGVLTFKESPDYEMQADADADNTYMVTIHATDATMKTGMKTVMVMVADEDEMAPEMSLLERYDADDNGQIDVDELREAITHYILGDIDLDDVREIIKLYILG